MNIRAGFHRPRSSLLFVNARRNWWKWKFPLHCATLRKDKHDLDTLGTSKDNGCLHAFGWNRNLLIPWECNRDPNYSSYFGEKYFEKKGAMFPEKVVKDVYAIITPDMQRRNQLSVMRNCISNLRSLAKRISFNVFYMGGMWTFSEHYQVL